VTGSSILKAACRKSENAAVDCCTASDSNFDQKQTIEEKPMQLHWVQMD
jgi:hypothetical protein